jgi:hypothetical protein
MRNSLLLISILCLSQASGIHLNKLDSSQLVQTGADNQFIGTVLWDAVDLVTFGAFEKHSNRTK